jgi:2,3-bisphosphoglycerate-independent phosphoglycerate mutase
LKPVVLLILDGWGLAPEGPGNAISLAHTPNFDAYWKKFPHSKLQASGEGVGLPPKVQGNSEAGHTNLGAGRIVMQMLGKISAAVQDKSFYRNPAFLKAVKNCKENNSALHLMGLVQDEGVHAHHDHLFALLELAKKEGVEKVWVHFFSDGRDTPPKSALRFLEILEKKMKEIGAGKIGLVCGRYYAMDRDKRWERTEKAFRALTLGDGLKEETAKKAIEEAYLRGESDEFIKPTLIGDFSGVKEKDSIIFFNYRPDRTRQLTKAFVEKEFEGFERIFIETTYVCLTDYYKGVPALVAFKEERLKGILAEALEKAGIKNLRLSETEKYAHVTYFFNAQREKPFEGEERILVPSPKVDTYDLQPEMSVFEVEKNLLRELEAKNFDLIICNLVNADMVGHTGEREPIIKALEAVDTVLGRAVEKVRALEGVALICADHGNAESILTREGGIMTAHTLNPVPFIAVSDRKKIRQAKARDGVLSDISPTILKLLGVKKPKEMAGKSLLSFG